MRNRLGQLSSGLCVMALSACMGGGDGDDPVVLSEGILSLEVPDDATYNGLPMSVQTLVDEVIASNENSGVATQPGAGTSDYSGTFGLIVDEDGALVTGTADLAVDAASSITYTYTATEIDDPDNVDATVAGSFGGTAVVAGGLFGGDIDGTIDYDEDGAGGGAAVAVTVDGTVSGAFDVNLDGFGAIEGTITTPGDTEPFYGLFHTTQDP